MACLPIQPAFAPNGEMSFNGPRVRMGIHWAQKGTFNQRLHPLTKHRIFAGPGWRIAQEIGDAACGGQVSRPFLSPLRYAWSKQHLA